MKKYLNEGLKSRIVVFILAIVVTILWLVIRYSNVQTFLNYCSGDGLCESNWLFGVIKPIYTGTIYLVPSILIIVFLSFSILKTWLKIMIPYTVIALILIANTSEVCTGMICFDRTLVASGFSKIFLILTILIILSKSLYLWIVSRRNKPIS